MPTPATTGQLRTTIQDMEIGDYIDCEYDSANSSPISATKFKNLGFATKAEIPVTGAQYPNGTFYFIKVDKGLLISDRVIQHTVTWDSLNSWKVIQGLPWDVGIIRSLTGGVAYANEFGDSSTSTVDGGYGAWPTINEWDKYIVSFPIDKIQTGKTLDDVFHWNRIWTWVQDTPINGLINPFGSTSGSSGQRIVRGNDLVTRIANTPSNLSSERGFRPVFEYKEV